jgi:hypothetical protein
MGHDQHNSDVHRNAEELRRFLEHVGWKGYEADRRAGVARGRTAAYLAERYQPKPEYLDALARSSGMAKDWRSLTLPTYAAGVPYADKPQEPSVVPEMVDLPYAGEVPASSQWGDPLVGTGSVEVPAKFGGTNRFVAKVVGRSMSPALYQADMIVFEHDLAPPVGVVVLAQRKGDHGPTIKKLEQDPETGEFRLHAVNAYAEAPPDGEGWGVVAKMVGMLRTIDGTQVELYNAAGVTPRALILGAIRREFR